MGPGRRRQKSLDEGGKHKQGNDAHHQLDGHFPLALEGFAPGQLPGNEKGVGEGKTCSPGDEYRRQFGHPVRPDVGPEGVGFPGPVEEGGEGADERSVIQEDPDGSDAEQRAEGEAEKGHLNVVHHDLTGNDGMIPFPRRARLGIDAFRHPRRKKQGREPGIAQGQKKGEKGPERKQRQGDEKKRNPLVKQQGKVAEEKSEQFGKPPLLHGAVDEIVGFQRQFVQTAGDVMAGKVGLGIREMAGHLAIKKAELVQFPFGKRSPVKMTDEFFQARPPGLVFLDKRPEPLPGLRERHFFHLHRLIVTRIRAKYERGEETMENRVAVITPEYVEIRFETAGLGSRAAAKLIDFALISLVNFLLLTLSLPFTVLVISGHLPASVFFAVFLVVSAALPLAYFVLTEYFTGQTVGKRIMGLRLVTDTGQSPGFWAIFLRNVLILADLFLLIGLIFMWLHRKEKRIGDLAAGTLVIRERKSKRKKGKSSLAELPLSEDEKNRLRPFERLGDDQYLLIEEFLKRRSQMDPDRRKALAQNLLRRIQADGETEPDDAELLLEKIYAYLKQTRYSSIQ